MKPSPLFMTTILLLEGMENIILAVAMNGVTGFGECNKESLAYEPLLKAKLIDDNGKPTDSESLIHALDYEIQRRQQAGTWK